MLENTPGRRADEVNVVSGDGFFDQNMAHKLGFPSAKFVADWHHLFKDGLDDYFGKQGCTLLKGSLTQMIKAKSEEHFNKALHNARLILQNQVDGRDLELEHKLDEFASKKHTYAEYCLDQTKGTRGLHGSSMSEQNHSSVLCNLNDGDRKVNKYQEYPVTLAKDLFERQSQHVLKFNKLLFDEQNMMATEIERLKQAQRTETNNDILKAAKKLCKAEYERYKANRLRADDSLLLYKDGDMYCIVCSDSDSTSEPPRRFHAVDDECDCVERVAHESQCPHMIKLKEGFDANLFQLRHMRRTKVVGSLKGWEHPIQTDNLLGGDEDISTIENDPFDDDGEEANELQVTVQKENALIDLTPKEVRPLGKKNLSELLSQVNSFYNNCKDDVKFVVGAMAINLKKLVMEGVKNATQMSINAQSASSDMLMETTRDMVRQYQSAFTTSSGAFHVEELNLAKPSATALKSAPQHRLKRKKETARSAASNKKKQTTKGRSVQCPPAYSSVNANIDSSSVNANINGPRQPNACGFCGERVGHTVTGCPQRRKLQAEGTEYNVSQHHFSLALISNIESSMQFSQMNMHDTNNVVSNVVPEMLRYHAVIHKKYAPMAAGANGINGIQNFMFNISLLVTMAKLILGQSES